MVYLYKNKLPNYAENTHVFFDDVNDYITYLGDVFLQFTEDRYTMNGNIAEVELPITTDFDNVTYIAWNNSGAWRFYFVRSAVYQSGYAIFTLDVDLWATYISQAILSNITVLRCNRNIGTGIYDPIKATQGREFIQLGEDMDANDLAIVFVAAFATGVSTILGNNAGTYLGVYEKELIEFDHEDPFTGEITHISSIYTDIERVGSIYGVEANIGSLDANVIKAYIVPSNVVTPKNVSVPKFKYKSTSLDSEFTPEAECVPFIYSIRFEIPINPNYKYYVGTKHAGLELLRTTTPVNVLYNFIVKQDGIQVTVQQGDRMLDITDAFQIGLTSNEGNLTSLERISKILQIGTSLAASYVTAGIPGLTLGGIGTTSQVIAEGNTKYIQGGDGVSTCTNVFGFGVTPYYMQTNSSIIDEKAHARLYGATFNEQVENLDDVFTADLLGEGTLTDTYFAAEVRVDGVPTDARDVIAAVIRGGIYAVKL